LEGFFIDSVVGITVAVVATWTPRADLPAEGVLPALQLLKSAGSCVLCMTRIYHHNPTSCLYPYAALVEVVAYFCSPVQRVISMPSGTPVGS